MKLSLLTAIVLLLLAQTLALTQTQTAPRGRIEGVVVEAGNVSPQPLAGARITVTKVNSATGQSITVAGRMVGTSITTGGITPFPGMSGDGQRGAQPVGPRVSETTFPIPPVTTDRDGKFVIPDLAEGSYTLLITKNGYVRQEYGQRVFPGQGTLINLAAGEVIRDLAIRLTLTGNLGGRIVDNDGQPAVGVPLQLLKASYNQLGQRIFRNAGTSRTNDRGEYRFYWVTPGRYYVAGGQSAATFTFAPGNSSPNESGDNFTLTYYPGVTEPSRATPVEIRSGSENVLDFAVPRQQLYTISGKIVNPAAAADSGGKIPAVTISLAFQTLTGSTGVFTMGQGYDSATGNFVLRDILPGSYILQAAAPPSSARLPVEVTNTNIEGLTVSLDGGVNINGRFIVDGGDMPAPNTLRVQMRLVDSGLEDYLGTAPGGQNAAADGSFNITGVLPGMYRVVVAPTQDFYVKELRYDRADALRGPIEVSRRNSDSGTMEVVISRNVGQLDGSVQDERAQPVPGVQAVLIPDARDRSELYKTATTDQTGHFIMRGITPGDYKLFAWEALENFGYFDPDVMRRSENFGKAIQVTESSRLGADLKIIPAGQ